MFERLTTPHEADNFKLGAAQRVQERVAAVTPMQPALATKLKNTLS